MIKIYFKFHVFLFPENSTCQTKCEVKIENLSKYKNILWDVKRTFGTAIIRYYTPCLEKDGHTLLTMIINCQNWNTGKYIRQTNFKLNVTILQSLSILIFFIACKNKLYVHITSYTSEIDLG